LLLAFQVFHCKDRDGIPFLDGSLPAFVPFNPPKKKINKTNNPL
jgi:hypothetical protein